MIRTIASAKNISAFIHRTVEAGVVHSKGHSVNKVLAIDLETSPDDPN